ncbi:MAG: hypothetical protein ACR2I5_01235 [Candidatus Limnocylindria bacterium]
MMVSGTRRIVASLSPLAGGVGSFAVDGLYLAAIDQQGVTPPGGRVVFVALWIAAAGLLAVSGAFMRPPSVRAAALGLGAAMLIALGAPAVFSIGIPLLLCGALVAAGAIRAAELAPIPKWVGVAGPIGLLGAAAIGVAIGFVLTDF